jgi:putative DNA primase/helicase
LPTILKNAETFASAGAAELGTQRMGDQIGSLLAGVYSLHSDKEISYDAAVAWIKDKDWSDEKGLQGSNDEIRLVSHLVEQIVSVETDTGRHDRTVGELVNISKNEFDVIDKFVNATDADKQLRRIGFKVDLSGGEPLLIVSNNSYWIRSKLANTAWPENHHTILARISGAHKVESTQFAPGVRQRGVAIPIGALWP